MKYLISIIAATLSLVACGDYAPDSDIQISCRGEHAAELCAYAANAAADLNPQVADQGWQIYVRDPEVTGVTMRDADPWVLETVPEGTVVCATSGKCRTLSLRHGDAGAVTDYEHRRVPIVEGLVGHERFSLELVVWHELIHALGEPGHLPGEHDIGRAQQILAGHESLHYTPNDVAAIRAARSGWGNGNNIAEALWAD